MTMVGEQDREFGEIVERLHSPGNLVSRRRRVTNHVATAALALACVAAFLPLVLVLYYVISRGMEAMSWDFLTQNIPIISNSVGPGMAPAIVGTLVITLAASAMSIPIGVLGAVYLNEYGKQRPLARAIRFLTDVMTGVPSIVMGLFIYEIWVLRYKNSGLAGAMALACLMLPIVVRSCEEMLKLVPNHLREASAALGSRTWRTSVSVVIPAALPGIVSGSMLAVARAAGETAPLLFTIGIVTKVNASLSGPNTALSTQIFRNASSPFVGPQQRAWGAALTLIVLVFVLTALARLVASRFSFEQR